MAAPAFYLLPIPPGDAVAKMLSSSATIFKDAQLIVNIQSNLGTVALNGIRGTNLENPEYVAGQFARFGPRSFAVISRMSVASVNQNGQSGETLTLLSEDTGVKIEVTNVDQGTGRMTEIGDALSAHFTLIPFTDTLQFRLPQEQQKLLGLSQQIIAGFAAEGAKLSQQAAAQSVEASRVLTARLDELEQRFQEKEAELARRHADRVAAVEQKEKQHAESVSAFELRNNTAVRRDLLAQIQKIIQAQKEANLSSGTAKKRLPVHYICWGVMALAGLTAGFFIHHILTSTATWTYLAPLSASVLTFVSTAIYYIRWNDVWFRDHAAVEFTNLKFSSDILRASWIAELVFEWESKKGREFPAELIESFARGLFVATVATASAHPFDDITGLAKGFSKLRVTKSGVEIEKKTETKDIGMP